MHVRSDSLDTSLTIRTGYFRRYKHVLEDMHYRADTQRGIRQVRGEARVELCEGVS